MDGSFLRNVNGDEDEDAALRRAIALSMGEVDDDSETVGTVDTDEEDNAGQSMAEADNTFKDHENVVDLDSQPHESHKPSPVPPKLFRQKMSSSAKQESAMDAAATPSSTSSPAIASVSLLSLDRRAMEAERLARRRKQLEQQQQVLTADGPKEKILQIQGQEDGAVPAAELLQANLHVQQSWKLQPGPSSSRPKPKRKAEAPIIVIDDDDDDGLPPARKRKLDDVGNMEETGDEALPSRPLTILPGGLRNNSATSPARVTKRPSSGPVLSSTPKSNKSVNSDLPFAKGAVKKTWVRGQPRLGDDITIDEVWQKDKLELAVLSSFQWDEDWVLGRLDLNKTRLLLIAYAADEDTKEQMQANVPRSVIRFCFPPMPIPGAMHSKLQLLKFSSHMRIVVPTGNLVPYDWGESGHMENMVFLIDLPRLPEQDAEQSVSTPFLEDLSYFLKAQDVSESLIRSLRKYDFSETERYSFVHSICGSHTDNAWQCTGYPGLGKAVKAMGWESEKSVQVDYLCSSVGAVKDDLLSALYYACQGDSGTKEFEMRTSKPRSSKAKAAALASSSASHSNTSPRDFFRVYFPSEETVVDSRAGRDGAGTICFQSKWWGAPTFPREVLRDAKSVRQGVLMHTKLLLVRGQSTSSDAGSPTAARAWAYVGSANMSESAWGRIVKDKPTGKMKITCRNWECGVLVPASTGSDGADHSSSASFPSTADNATESSTMLDVFRGSIPVPFTVPGAKYGPKHGTRRPWFFMEP